MSNSEIVKFIQICHALFINFIQSSDNGPISVTEATSLSCSTLAAPLDAVVTLPSASTYWKADCGKLESSNSSLFIIFSAFLFRFYTVFKSINKFN